MMFKYASDDFFSLLPDKKLMKLDLLGLVAFDAAMVYSRNRHRETGPLNDDLRRLTVDRRFLNSGSHASMRSMPKSIFILVYTLNVTISYLQSFRLIYRFEEIRKSLQLFRLSIERIALYSYAYSHRSNALTITDKLLVVNKHVERLIVI